jgi:hypothetical protein
MNRFIMLREMTGLRIRGSPLVRPILQSSQRLLGGDKRRTPFREETIRQTLETAHRALGRPASIEVSAIAIVTIATTGLGPPARRARFPDNFGFFKSSSRNDLWLKIA